ncbi:type II secretion system F family protein [Thioalkalivibrio sp. ALR17-21]|uniref:type II secretion system F family protein n=1 Tax=Thioalkalivibrio sp. ALR17-21 TaxID=1269813 RepID=UPI000462B7B3|nr:type II secretion system F family protein [Thioalkalivibrio sp. ALR17-21]
MTLGMWLLLMAVLLLLGGGVMTAWLWWQGSGERDAITARLEGTTGAEAVNYGSAAGVERPERTRTRPSAAGLVARLRGSDPELARLLRRAGLIRPAKRRTTAFMVQFAPIVLVAVLFLLLAATGDGLEGGDLLVLGAGGLAALMLPRRVIAAVANERGRRIGDQVNVMVQLLRMLFDSGQSADGALRVVATESRALIPDLAAELDVVLQKVGTGVSLAQALGDMAEGLEVAELDDAVLILKQLVEQGGDVKAPLQRLSQLIEDRQRTRVQERVNKMSARMSVVMMLFLFPALLAVLAAPGFIGLIDALGGVGDG